ncbi:hypothetical protein SAMN05216284_119109 [Micromonospora sediminimaris]|nr:hypothetical protein SAMN05216284_119109 [Micromonospora sediminimaris]
MKLLSRHAGTDGNKFMIDAAVGGRPEREREAGRMNG